MIHTTSDDSESDYELVDERSTDTEEWSRDTNYVLSPWDNEDDTPDNGSTFSEDSLGESDSDNISLGGDNSHHISLPSSSSNSTTYTPSVLSLDSDIENDNDNYNDYSESILNNTLSFPSSLSGSNATLKFPTASTPSSSVNQLSTQYSRNLTSYRDDPLIGLDGQSGEVSNKNNKFWKSLNMDAEKPIKKMDRKFDYWGIIRMALLTIFVGLLFCSSGTVHETLNFQIESSYDLNGDPFTVSFEVNRSISMLPPSCYLSLSRLSTVNGSTTYEIVSNTSYSPPTFQNSYKFFIPESERWGVLNGSLSVYLDQTRDFEVVQKLLLYYGGEINHQFQLSDTLVCTFQHTNEPSTFLPMDKVRDIYKSYVEKAQQRVLNLYGRTKTDTATAAHVSPHLESRIEPGLGGIITSAMGLFKQDFSYLTNVVTEFAEVAQKHFRVFLKHLNMFFSEISKINVSRSAENLGIYLKEISKTSVEEVTNSPQYQYASNLGSNFILKSKDAVSEARKAALQKTRAVKSCLAKVRCIFSEYLNFDFKDLIRL